MPKKKQSILVVDPDRALGDILVSRYEKAGFSSKSIKSLALAKTAMKRKKFDLIILDPEEESDPVASLNDLFSEHSIRTIIFTKKITREKIVQLKQVGADTYWIKGHLSLAEMVKKLKKRFI